MHFHTITIWLFATLMLMGCNKSESGGTTPVTPTVRDVQTFVTTADNTMHFDKIGRDFIQGTNMNPEITMVLNTNKRYQQFDGFGAAITGATAFNLMQMSADKREAFLKEIFCPDTGMGYSYVRVPIGGSDFNARSNYDYTCCDVPGIENFALTSDENDYIIPILQQIIAINPDIKVMGSPWSCPRWMKVSDISSKTAYNSWTGGYLNPDYYADYATYFVKWIQSFAAQGIAIESVTVQNEPLNPGNCISLLFPWEQERDFIKTALGPAFEQAGLTTKIIVFDHNYNYDGQSDQAQYPLKIYADATAKQYIDGAAYHNYGGSVSELSTIHNGATDMNLYFTEASIGTWNYSSFESSLIDQAKNVCLANAMNWCKAVIVWNLLLDDNGGPHGGAGACTTCYGAADISSKDYTTLTRRSQFYAIGHMSKVLKPGSTRIDIKGYKPTNVTVCAAENPDGTYGVVLLNENDNGLTFQIEAGSHFYSITLPGKSITSCLWQQ